MVYTVKETYYTLQGEGAQAGMAAVFCRFAGCNLWSGLERDRSSAICKFCDTDFVGTDGPGGGKFTTPQALCQHIDQHWSGSDGQRMVVFTGGEPLLQLDTALIDALHDATFRIAVESNGTLPLPDGIDWLCISPKAGSDIVVHTGDELKLVYPQADMMPDQIDTQGFRHLFLQPMDDPHGDRDRWGQNTKAAIDYVKSHPQWRLSVQSHKYLEIP